MSELNHGSTLRHDMNKSLNQNRLKQSNLNPSKLSQSSRSQGLNPSNLNQNSLQGKLLQIIDELVQQGVTLEQARKEFEKQFIVASIRSNGGNLGRSARSLGVHRNTLRNKVSNLGIETEDYDPRAAARRLRRRFAAKLS